MLCFYFSVCQPPTCLTPFSIARFYLPLPAHLKPTNLTNLHLCGLLFVNFPNFYSCALELLFVHLRPYFAETCGLLLLKLANYFVWSYRTAIPARWNYFLRTCGLLLPEHANYFLCTFWTNSCESELFFVNIADYFLCTWGTTFRLCWHWLVSSREDIDAESFSGDSVDEETAKPKLGMRALCVVKWIACWCAETGLNHSLCCYCYKRCGTKS